MFSPQNLLTEWSRLTIAALVRAGVRQLVISPGSRNTPLTVQALATPELRCHSVIDERSAGFFALGLARAGGPPAVLLCTSGSALTHYFPALIEATHAGLPLLVLSADRPHELDVAGAPQTIEQANVFGNYSKFSLDLGEPAADDDSLFALSRKVQQAVCESQSGRPGPVHLNFRARKPLEPLAPQTPEQLALVERVSRVIGNSPAQIFPSRLAAPQAAIDVLAACFRDESQLVLSVGPLPTALTQKIVALGHSQKVYVLCEQPGLSTPVDGLARGLGGKNGAHLPLPQRVLHFGPSPISSAWQAGMKKLDLELYCVSGVRHPDPTSRARFNLVADLDDTVERLRAALASSPPPPDRSQFTATYERAAAAVCEAIERETTLGEYSRHSLPPTGPRRLSEPALLRSLLSALPPGTHLCLGNSLPIRLAAWLSPLLQLAGLSVHTQRGASGIDGLIAGAAGTATATGEPTVLVLGDVSAAHDLASLAVARTLKTPLCIVVVDNGGGAIFDHLPAAEQLRDQSDWAFWTTPPRLDFGALCRGYGINFEALTSLESAGELLRAALRRPSATLLLARTDAESSQVFLRAMGPGPRPPGGFN